MEGLLARELVAELEDLTRAMRGLVRLVAYVLELEVPPGETRSADGLGLAFSLTLALQGAQVKVLPKGDSLSFSSALFLHFERVY